METKVCTWCKEEKLISEFGKDKKKKDGLNCWCKECVKLKGREWYSNNLEKGRERNKQYRKKYPERIKEYTKKFNTNNPEKIKEKVKKWKQENPQKVNEISNRFRKKNPLRYLLQKCICRAKKKNIPYDNFEDLYDYLEPNFNIGKCECCGCELESGYGKGIKNRKGNTHSIDQIIAGNGYVVNNVAIICVRCNTIKSYGDIEDHRRIADWQEKMMLKNNQILGK